MSPILRETYKSSRVTLAMQIAARKLLDSLLWISSIEDRSRIMARRTPRSRLPVSAKAKPHINRPPSFDTFLDTINLHKIHVLYYAIRDSLVQLEQLLNPSNIPLLSIHVLNKFPYIKHPTDKLLESRKVSNSTFKLIIPIHND